MKKGDYLKERNNLVEEIISAMQEVAIGYPETLPTRIDWQKGRRTTQAALDEFVETTILDILAKIKDEPEENADYWKGKRAAIAEVKEQVKKLMDMKGNSYPQEQP